MIKHHTPLSLLFALSLACDAAVAANQQAAAEAEAKAEVKSEAKAEVKADAQAEGGLQAIAGDIVAGAEAKADAPTAVAGAEVKAGAEINGADLDLESVTYLVKKGKVKNAAELEKKINNPKEKINDIDVDGDGKVDFIKIVEVKKDDGVIVFELHAIPSSTKDEKAAVVVAYVNFAPDKTTNTLVVKATYAPVVVGYETVVYDYTVPIVVKNDTVVVSGGVGFYGWLYAPRPAYVGVVVWGPPVVVVHHEGCWPPGHCKHGKRHKFKGKGKGKWGWH